MTRYFMVFVTVPNVREGNALTRLVLNKRRAACVTQIPGLRSTYWWKGKLSSSRENLLLIKTTAKVLPALMKEIWAHHSYDVPEIVALPIVKGLPAYLQWLDTETKKPRS